MRIMQINRTVFIQQTEWYLDLNLFMIPLQSWKVTFEFHVCVGDHIFFISGSVVPRLSLLGLKFLPCVPVWTLRCLKMLFSSYLGSTYGGNFVFYTVLATFRTRLDLWFWLPSTPLTPVGPCGGSIFCCSLYSWKSAFCAARGVNHWPVLRAWPHWPSLTIHVSWRSCCPTLRTQHNAAAVTNWR